MNKKIFKIDGMHCNSCANRIENALNDKKGIINVKASFAKEEASVEFDDNISESEIKNIIKNEGYEIVGEEVYKEEGKEEDSEEIYVEKTVTKGRKSDKIGWLVLIGAIALLFIIVYYFFIKGLDLQVPGLDEQTSLIILFLVGILTGFHCIAMCGGFVVSYTAKNAIKGHKSYKQHFIYGGSKVISYAIIGGIFGLIGGVFAFSVGLRGGIAIFAGIFMIVYSLNLFGFKYFRWFQVNPKFLTRFAGKASKNAEGPYKAPLITGLLSGLFIACGPLQAMYLYAMGIGSFQGGVFSLAAFGLGTLPVMIGFGSFATAISHKTTKKILKFSAILVLVLGLIMLNRGLLVVGSPVSYESIKETIIHPETGQVVMKGDYQEINMEVNRYGWEPDSFVLKKGVPVKWNIDVKELTGCNNEILVRDYGIDIKLKKGLNVVEFTPDKTGTVRWSCWMGMIPGSFVITDSGEASQQELAAAAPASSGGGCTGGSDGGSCGSPTCGASTGGSCGCGG
ncbi:MAG: sulfite exporter TauE/SafE family protein [archaeon]